MTAEVCQVLTERAVSLAGELSAHNHGASVAEMLLVFAVALRLELCRINDDATATIERMGTMSEGVLVG